MHLLHELEEQMKWWGMMIFPVEITNLVVEFGLVIGSLTAVEYPVLVSVKLFQEPDNLQKSLSSTRRRHYTQEGYETVITTYL